tara:strand:+ start:22994 stop:23110 length:117 start_codon:yes stop_codon:yes gene_type:complete
MPWESEESDESEWEEDEEMEYVTQAPDPEELGFDVPVL